LWITSCCKFRHGQYPCPQQQTLVHLMSSAKRVRVDESNGPELAASQLLYLLSGKLFLCEPSRRLKAVMHRPPGSRGVESTAAAVLSWQGD
jgi:hypothetical protein